MHTSEDWDVQEERKCLPKGFAILYHRLHCYLTWGLANDSGRLSGSTHGSRFHPSHVDLAYKSLILVPRTPGSNLPPYIPMAIYLYHVDLCAILTELSVSAKLFAKLRVINVLFLQRAKQTTRNP